MTPLAIVSLEGLLVEGTDLKASPPSATGRSLYESLKSGYQIVIVSNQSSFEHARAWLRREHFVGYGSVFCYPATTIMSLPMWKASVVREMQAEGWAIGMYVDSDPDAVRHVFLGGTPTLLVSVPKYARPEWRPDVSTAVRPWDDLVSTIEAEQLLRAPEE